MSMGANWLTFLRHAINSARIILALSVFTARHKLVNSHLYFPKIDINQLISINTFVLTLYPVVTLINPFGLGTAHLNSSTSFR